MGIDDMQPTEHTLFLIGKLLSVIRKHKESGSYMLTHSGGGDGRKKRKREGMCGGTHTTFLLCFGEERNKAQTLSCEGTLDVAGYAYRTQHHYN